MSIDNRIWVPAGARSDKDLRYTKYKCGEVMPSQRYTAHEVFVAHGGNILIDEHYFFEGEALRTGSGKRVTRNASISSATGRQATATTEWLFGSTIG
jgi:hypothetical protein